LLDDILYRTLSSGRGLRRGCLPMSKCGVDLCVLRFSISLGVGVLWAWSTLYLDCRISPRRTTKQDCCIHLRVHLLRCCVALVLHRASRCRIIVLLMLSCGQQYDDTVGNPLAVVDRALHGAWSARQGLFLLSIFLKSLAFFFISRCPPLGVVIER
jgi:hypothetical protein